MISNLCAEFADIQNMGSRAKQRFEKITNNTLLLVGHGVKINFLLNEHLSALNPL